MKFKILFSLLALTFLGSCSKDYLDTDVNEYLTNDRKNELILTNPATTTNMIRGSLNGVYDIMKSFNLNGNKSQDYFGLKSIQLATDLTSEDVVQDKDHLFGFDYNFDNREASYRRTSLVWALFYKMVSSSNQMLNDYFAVDVTDKSLLSLKSEILAIRGIAYYHLINLYQQTYKGNENKLGVPLVLKTTDDKMPRAKVADVYKQIISDLEYAVGNGVVTADKKDADKRVAAAYLAKTYAQMEEWPMVEKYALIATEGASLMSESTYENAFVDIANSEWLWGYDITGSTTTKFASFYSHADNTIGGYPSLGITKSIHSILYNKINNSDVRKKLFVNKTTFPEIAAKYSKLANFVGLKYKTPADFTGDYGYIRVADPYLLLAESLVEQNQLAKAKACLFAFVSTRQKDYKIDLFNTQEELRQEVRFQRRIELWCEGSAFFDFKRWNLGVVRTTVGSNHRTKIDVPAGDRRFVYQIPQKEIDANPNIQEQNP
jgi:hypothetical protein